MLLASRKDVLPANQNGSVIDEYKCHCDSWYVRRTSQRFQDRIKQHVPIWLQHTGSQRVQPDRVCKRKQPTLECDLAIGQPILKKQPLCCQFQLSVGNLKKLKANYTRVP